ILEDAGLRSPMQMKAEEFNLQAERYYRDTLRRRHISEAFEFLAGDLRAMERRAEQDDGALRSDLRDCLKGRGAAETAERLRSRVVTDEATEDELRALINLALLSVSQDLKDSENWIASRPGETSPESEYERGMDARADALDSTPVYGSWRRARLRRAALRRRAGALALFRSPRKRAHALPPHAQPSRLQPAGFHQLRPAARRPDLRQSEVPSRKRRQPGGM